MGDDETLLMNLTGDGPCATSTTGLIYCVDWFQVSENVIVILFDGEMNDGPNWDDALMGAFAGLETDPDLLASKGLATYSGGYNIEFVSVDEDFWDDVDGEIVINADFAGETVDGSLLGNGGTDWDVAFEGEIAGNGWTATDTGDTEIFGGDLEIEGGGIQFDGVFYGETGEETAGTIIVDVVIGDGEDFSVDITGVGGFLAWEQITAP